MLKALLPLIGLSPEETSIYEFLLQNGPQTASQLAKNTPIKRTYIYTLCEQMIKKKLLKKAVHQKKTIYSLLSPSNLLQEAETRRNQAQYAYLELEAVLPGLISLYTHNEEKPVVRVFEGLEGVKKVYLDTLKENQPILALVETSHLHPEVYAWVTREYAQKRVEAGIHVRAIVSSGPNTPKYSELDVKELRETRIVDSKLFPFKNEINLYGNKLAIINHQKDSNLLGIIIERSQMAETFRSWFDLTWSLIKE